MIKCVDEGNLPYIKQNRPKIHFTANTGWINDPNGLVYDKGIYHLYFQYNPFHIYWQNMCLGHAVSKDLLHWKQLDTVMTPDENGTIFSGSAIINERECLDLPEELSISCDNENAQPVIVQRPVRELFSHLEEMQHCSINGGQMTGAFLLENSKQTERCISIEGVTDYILYKEVDR